MNITELKKHADSIPDLGYGGKTYADDLMARAYVTKPDRIILELAPYIGSASAYICLGLTQNPNKDKIKLHTYDLWEIDKEYMRKAEKYNGLKWTAKDNMLDIYMENLKPFKGIDIIPHKQDVFKLEYWNPESKIAMFIDDIGAAKWSTDFKFKLFSPAFIPDETIIFMADYYFCESHPAKEFQYQQKFFNANKNVFEFIKKVPGSKCAIFKYLGGEINYGVEE